MVGQEEITTLGVFGPIPVPLETSNDYSSIIYATHISNIYVLFCLIYPSMRGDYFFNVELVDSCFEKKVSAIKNISQINMELLKGLKIELIKALNTTPRSSSR